MRCSRCKHAFFLQHPDQSQADGVDAVVEEAVHGDATPTPGATRDLSVAHPEDSAAAQTVAATVAPTDEEDFIDDEEDDWEFNEDLPDYDDDEDDVGGEGFAADALGHDSSSDMSIELADDDDDDDDEDDVDLAEDDFADGASELEADPSEMSANDLMSSSIAVEPDSPFEAVDDDGDDGIPLADDSAMPETVEGVREEAFGSVEDFSALAEPDPATTPMEAAPQAPAASAASEEENIEDPESWDFFGDGGATNDAPCTPQDPFGAALSAPTQADAGDDAIQDAMSDQDWPKLGENKAMSAAGRIGNALAWTLVCAAIGLGVALGLRDIFDPGVRAPAFVSIGEMRAANVKGQWVETAGMGTLYVVSGDLLNPGTAPAAPNLAIEVRLLDDAGPLADWPTAHAGSGIEFDTLRTLPAAELGGLRTQAISQLAWSEIPAGESIRFAAIFERLPDAAAHFELAAAEIDGVVAPPPVAEPGAPQDAEAVRLSAND